MTVNENADTGLAETPEPVVEAETKAEPLKNLSC